jgi:hypothetical protein
VLHLAVVVVVVPVVGVAAVVPAAAAVAAAAALVAELVGWQQQGRGLGHSPAGVLTPLMALIGLLLHCQEVPIVAACWAAGDAAILQVAEGLRAKRHQCTKTVSKWQCWFMGIAGVNQGVPRIRHSK